MEEETLKQIEDLEELYTKNIILELLNKKESIQIEFGDLEVEPGKFLLLEKILVEDPGSGAADCPAVCCRAGLVAAH